MRLTLRTLLAYIDDTLEPAQAREIGQKVGESHVAQELIERIRKVTRRRGLTIPPVEGPDRTDPNTVAEYLDNDLSSEKIAEVEELSLNSDVHLAEIAACHQILTLVLGEPANVPPTARQRMYQLVKGRESDASRRATRVIPKTEPHSAKSLHDFKQERRKTGYRLIGAAVLGVALAIAIWQALPPRQPRQSSAPEVAGTGTPAPPNEDPGAPKPVPKPDENPKPPDDPEPPKPPKPPEPAKQPIDVAPDRKPSTQRKEFGKFASKDAVLLSRDGEGPWTRVAPEARVGSAVSLLSLPGYHSEIRLDSGARLTLWGNLPDVMPGGFLESQVTLHVPPAQFDIDFTLDRGRVFLASGEKPVAARIRFANEIWDVTLAGNQAEIVVDTVTLFDGEPFRKDGKGESPRTTAELGVIAGTATVKVDARSFDLVAPPGPCGLTWESKKTGLSAKPLELMSLPAKWGKQPLRPLARDRQQEIESALQNLLSRIGAKNKAVDVAISELAEGASRTGKLLAIRSCGALGTMPSLLDGFEDQQLHDLRQGAVLALQSFIARQPANDQLVFEQLQAKLGYTDRQAEDAMTLLHGYRDAAFNEPGTYDALFAWLRNERVGLRELAYWWLAQADPDGAARARYNAGDSEAQRERAIAEWRKRIPEGKLPPGRTAPEGNLPRPRSARG